MALGLSFGSNKQKQNSTTTGTKNEVSTQLGTTNQAQTEQQSSFTSGLTNTLSEGTTSQQTAGTTQQATAGAEKQTGLTSLFSDAVLAQLEAAGLGALTQTSGRGAIDTSGLAFNSGQFIEDAVRQATAAAGVVRDTSTNGLFDSIGGTSKGNTMAALLDQQLAMQQQGAIAGARNEAAATAAGITQSNIASEIGVRGQDQDLMTQLLGLLRGGQQTSDIASQQEGRQTGSTTGSSIGQESQSQSSATQQQQDSISSLVSLITQLVSGETTTTGTETTKGTTKKKGGGFSLSI